MTKRRKQGIRKSSARNGHSRAPVPEPLPEDVSEPRIQPSPSEDVEDELVSEPRPEDVTGPRLQPLLGAQRTDSDDVLMYSPSPEDLPLGLLPRELLLALVDASPFPLQAYCQLIGLTHGIRTAIRGAPRVLSFQWPVPLLDDPGKDEYCMAPCLPADALAALVGPCKGLVRLTLPQHNRHHPSVLGCGLTPDEVDDVTKHSWVDEAFGGHTKLTYLEIPGAGTFWPAIWRILRHLPALEEFHFLNARPLRTRVLRALAKFCPKLRVLHFTQHSSVWHYGQDFEVLKPLFGTLKELIIPDTGLDGGTLDDRLAGFSSLERLEVRGGDMTSLQPIARHLTHLSTSSQLCARHLDQAGLCGLESLTSDLTSPEKMFAPVMSACRDTLRSLALVVTEAISPGRGLLAALGGLTHLTRLKLTLERSGGTLSAVLASLPPGLLENQLEYLALELEGDNDEETTYRLNSRSLREVYLRLAHPGSYTLTLTCPSLEKLALPYAYSSNPSALVLDCPHLKSLERLQGHIDLSHSTRMPELEVLGYDSGQYLDPAWLAQLMAWSPSRLRLLSHLTVSQAMLSQLFAGCPSLTTLRSIGLRLTATTDPPALLLRLPVQLEVLDGLVTVEGAQGPAELRMEAPGLRALRLEATPQMQLTLACPALVVLALGGRFSRREWDFLPVLAEAPDLPLRSLFLQCDLMTARLLAILTRHGSHLQRISLTSTWLAPDVWPEVAAALGRLPRLVSLTLYGIPSADVVLACPHLSHLTLKIADDEKPLKLRSLVLDCPQLEELGFPGGYLERLELVGEGEGGTAGRLSYIGDYLCDWLEPLKRRFPGAYLSLDRPKFEVIKME
ncbi:hypothetical protein PAPYR_7079 [Paratrimastix pyriformis]|uniref:Uncharacterized protein n=1 Tax=Paratrimastix pyriformis TaxID=342808 RepID=A0ABQ8UDZ1_9EUKA|nr:hypothetical protein PAPYR_7079 [Paratrimastix pyriformis]